MSSCTFQSQCSFGYTCSSNGYCVISNSDYNRAVKITTGVIIGIIVGIVALVLLCCGCGIFLCIRHRKKKKMLYGNPQLQPFAPAPAPAQTAVPMTPHHYQSTSPQVNAYVANTEAGFSSQTGINYSSMSPAPQHNQTFSPSPGTAAYQTQNTGGYQSYASPAPPYTARAVSPVIANVSPVTSSPSGLYAAKNGNEVSNVSIGTHTTGISHTPYTHTNSGTAHELPTSKEGAAYEMPAYEGRK